jgi:hypothetical protein
VTDDQMKRNSAIDQMMASVRLGEEVSYFVNLNGYWIEGYPYPADALTVNPGSASNIVRLPDGFECDCWFEPTIIQPHTLKGKAIVERQEADGGVVRLVKVRIKVCLEDIWGITAMVAGAKPAQLFLDPRVVERKTEFLKFTRRFFDRLDETDGGP